MDFFGTWGTWNPLDAVPGEACTACGTLDAVPRPEKVCTVQQLIDALQRLPHKDRLVYMAIRGVRYTATGDLDEIIVRDEYFQEGRSRAFSLSEANHHDSH